MGRVINGDTQALEFEIRMKCMFGCMREGVSQTLRGFFFCPPEVHTKASSSMFAESLMVHSLFNYVRGS